MEYNDALFTKILAYLTKKQPYTFEKTNGRFRINSYLSLNSSISNAAPRVGTNGLSFLEICPELKSCRAYFSATAFDPLIYDAFGIAIFNKAVQMAKEDVLNRVRKEEEKARAK